MIKSSSFVMKDSHGRNLVFFLFEVEMCSLWSTFYTKCRIDTCQEFIPGSTTLVLGVWEYDPPHVRGDRPSSW